MMVSRRNSVEKMRWRLFHLPETLTPKSHHPSYFSTSSSSFLVTKLPKKFRKKRTNPDSPRTKPVQSTPNRLPHLESLLDRDAYFRFLTRTKHFLSVHPHRSVPLSDAGKLHQQLGFPRGRSIRRFLDRHPLLLATHRDEEDKVWLGFSPLMDRLLDEERVLADSMEEDRVTRVRKLLMMSKERRIALNKLHHCRLLFGLPDDFRDRVLKYPDFFRVAVDGDGRRVLELASWDPTLAVSELERLFVLDEEKAKRAFRFPVKHVRELGLDVDDMRRLNLLSTLPLVSPYRDGGGGELDVWSVEAEKFRVGVLHEFLSLTLEKRASIHHIVEFREEFCLTKQTYDMLKRQPRTFYLAGTEMNWAVFLKDAYDETGELVDKDPQVVFDEKLRRYAMMKNEGDLEPRAAAGRWGDD